MTQLKRPVLGAFFSPLVIPVGYLCYVVASSERLEGLNELILFWITVVSYSGFLAIGYPLVKLLDSRNYLSIGILSVCGFASGILVGLIVWLVLGGLFRSLVSPSIEFIFAFGGLGALVAFVFGLLAGVRWSRDPLKDT